MVRLHVHTLLLAVSLLFAGAGGAFAEPIIESAKETDASGMTHKTYTITYDRRQFVQEGNHFQICNGKYLSYRNNTCSPASGVNRFNAERALTDDVKERLGADARIVSATVSKSDSMERKLIVVVTTDPNATIQSDVSQSNEGVISYMESTWSKIGNEYFTCKDGEMHKRKDQYLCVETKTLVAWIGGKDNYWEPMRLANHIQSEKGIPVRIIKVAESEFGKLTVIYKKTGEYSASIKSDNAPKSLGNNRPAFFQEMDLVWLADIAVAVVLFASVSLLLMALKSDNYWYVGGSLVNYVMFSISLNGFNLVILIVMIFSAYTAASVIKESKFNRSTLTERRVAAEAAQARLEASRLVEPLDSLRERQEQRLAGVTPQPNRSNIVRPQATRAPESVSPLVDVEEQTTNAVRKIVLD